MDRARANLLFRVIKQPSGKGDAMVIPTNKGITDCLSIPADDAVPAGANLHRLLAQRDRTQQPGLQRFKELDTRLQQQSVTRSRPSP